jgi:hypothetical protein
LLGLLRADADAASWTFDCTTIATADGVDVKGPYVQGPAGGRFIYLSWVTVDAGAEPTLFRRAKLWLDGVPPGVLDAAVEGGLLVGRLGLTDSKGNPSCAAVRPPLIEWRAGPPAPARPVPKGGSTDDFRRGAASKRMTDRSEPRSTP